MLAKNGGALPKMRLPVEWGIGSPLGDGHQYMPWIHVDDLCSIYIKAIEDDQMKGAYNAVAPDHVTNKNFLRVMAQVLEKPLWLPNIPEWVMKWVWGEMSEMLLRGSRISGDKIIASGFNFRFPNLESAMLDLLKGNTSIGTQ